MFNEAAREPRRATQTCTAPKPGGRAERSPVASTLGSAAAHPPSRSAACTRLHPKAQAEHTNPIHQDGRLIAPTPPTRSRSLPRRRDAAVGTAASFRKRPQQPKSCVPDLACRSQGAAGGDPEPPDKPAARCASDALPKRAHPHRAESHGLGPNGCASRGRPAAGSRRPASRRTLAAPQRRQEITRISRQTPQKNPNRARYRAARSTIRARYRGRIASSNGCRPVKGRNPLPGS